MDLFQKIKQLHSSFFKKNKAANYLLAVSGGVDSVVLAHLFYRLEMKVAIAHANFSLRGSASEKDTVFVEKLAKRYGLNFYTKNLAARTKAKEEGLSIQMSARELRYNWFKSLKEKFRYDYIVTAHHADDQLETILQHLVRGSGLSGLRGMLIETKEKLFRPLLPIDKSSILSYAYQQKLTWREDLSNKKCNYRRNFLRHKVTPWLKKLNPSLTKKLQDTTQRLLQAEQLLEKKAMEMKKDRWILKKKESIDLRLEGLVGEPAAPLLLSMWLNSYGFSFQQLQPFWQQNPPPGKQLFSATHEIEVRQNNYWLLRKRQPLVSEILTYLLKNEKLTLQTAQFLLTHQPVSKWPLGYTSDQKKVYLDQKKLKYPLLLRPWKPGDFFYPLGMQGKKKISDFLTDKKISLYEKRKVWVLCSEGSIVWVLGHQIDDRYKIEPTTSSALKLTVETFDF